MSAPINFVRFFCTHSVENNYLGVEGGKAFAAVLDPEGLSVQGGGLGPRPADRCTELRAGVVVVLEPTLEPARARNGR